MITAMGKVMEEAYRRGWITTRDGNVSVMDPDRGKFYITPSAVRKNHIKVEDIMRYSVDGDEYKVDGININRKASIEFDMHWFIHKDRKLKLGSVVHLHPTHCVAAMHAGIELSTLVKQFPELGRYTKVGNNVNAYYPGTDDLALQTSVRINGCDIVGQIGHGVTAYAKNPWDAFEHIERLEHICEIVLKSGVK